MNLLLHILVVLGFAAALFLTGLLGMWLMYPDLADCDFALRLVPAIAAPTFIFLVSYLRYLKRQRP